MELETDRFASILSEMFSSPEFHYPFVAAQQQFRERYYGMSSAAMLEDLFFDSLSSYLRAHRPGEELNRPPRGEKGYDYEFSGIKISHKVSKNGPTPLAALWDATRTDITEWTFDFPICFVSGGYSKKVKLKPLLAGRILQCELPSPQIVVGPGDGLILGDWSSNDEFRIQKIIEPKSSGEISKVVSFQSIWADVNQLSNSGLKANNIEIFVVRNISHPQLAEGQLFSLQGDCFRPGTYIFDRSRLSHVPVEHNNRAVLVPKSKVTELMKAAQSESSYVPLTIWFGAFAGLNPPDLYLSQRTHYDQMFSIYSQQRDQL